VYPTVDSGLTITYCTGAIPAIHIFSSSVKWFQHSATGMLQPPAAKHFHYHNEKNIEKIL